jgi:hypothetical protein
MSSVGLSVLNDDLNFGLGKEAGVINQLSCFFKEEIKKTANQFCPYDAVSDNSKYEIKCRRNKYSAYPTTIIPVSKTAVAGRLVFVFQFTDGLYYCVYDPIQFAKYCVSNICAYRGNGVKTQVPHYEIPIEKLIRILI